MATTTTVTCPFCGFAFEKADTLCSHGCPLGALCRLVRCPACEYEFPETPRAASWLARLFRRRQQRAATVPAAGDPSEPPAARPVAALEPGERGEVVCLGPGETSRHRVLVAFGLVPGAEVRLIQRRPACVVQIGETDLAIDPDIAATILVRPARASARVSAGGANDRATGV